MSDSRLIDAENDEIWVKTTIAKSLYIHFSRLSGKYCLDVILLATILDLSLSRLEVAYENNAGMTSKRPMRIHIALTDISYCLFSSTIYICEADDQVLTRGSHSRWRRGDTKKSMLNELKRLTRELRWARLCLYSPAAHSVPMNQSESLGFCRNFFPSICSFTNQGAATNRGIFQCVNHVRSFWVLFPFINNPFMLKKHIKKSISRAESYQVPVGSFKMDALQESLLCPPLNDFEGSIVMQKPS